MNRLTKPPMSGIAFWALIGVLVAFLTGCQPADFALTPSAPVETTIVLEKDSVDITSFTEATVTKTPSLRSTTPATEVQPTPSLTTISTAVPTATPTATLPPSATSLPWTEKQVIGTSVQGRPIEAIRVGNGQRLFVIMGAIHGAHECNTHDLVEQLLARFLAEPSLLPQDVTLYAVPLVNPDGCQTNSRSNANNVDLNRNWDTEDWTADAGGPNGTNPGSGGPTPFSEPETAALRDWFLTLLSKHSGPIWVVSYHSVVPDTGLIQPGYSQPGQPGEQADILAKAYAGATGYQYSATWVGNYTITGEFIHWANDLSLIAIDVELPDRGPANSVPSGWGESHVETNLHGLLTVFSTA